MTKFSLLVITFNRDKKVKRLFESLKMISAPTVKTLKSIITLDKKLFMRAIYNTNGIWQGFWRHKS